jgi:hypothetical protein
VLIHYPNPDGKSQLPKTNQARFPTPPAIDRATDMPSLQHKHILKTDFEDNDTPKKHLEIANHIPTTPVSTAHFTPRIIPHLSNVMAGSRVLK